MFIIDDIITFINFILLFVMSCRKKKTLENAKAKKDNKVKIFFFVKVMDNLLLGG